MKTIIASNKQYFLVPLLILFATTSACNHWDDLNTDPDNPRTVPNKLLLPSTQAGFAYMLSGDLTRIAGIINQHYVGVNRCGAMNIYIFEPKDFDNMWRFSLYGGPLNDLQIIINQAEAEGNFAYLGIAKIMTAMILGVATDIFGDIPYSEALQGADNLQPSYDSQQSIYASINRLLTEGIEDLKQPSDLLPTSDDLLFGGDLTRWQRLANGLKARMAIHQSKLNPQEAATNALAAISDSALTSNADNALVHFDEEATAANPLSQFITQRADLNYDGKVSNLLNDNDDPRFMVFFKAIFDTNDEVAYHTLGDVFAASSAAVPLFTYFEQKFIEAEAIKIQRGSARETYLAAIAASMEYAGVDGTDYIASLPDGEPSMEDIMTQKYIAMFTQAGESWTDWRRTGFPILQPTNGIEIPRRFLYPQTEYDFNKDAVPANVTVFTRMWWDSL